MNKLSKTILSIAIGMAAVGVIFGQQAKFPGRALTRHELAVNAADAKIGAEYINSYYLGYDLESAKNFIRSDQTREALAQLAFLWDELYLQPEASQIESVMRMVIRFQGTADQKIAKLETVRTNIEARLKTDHKWYYSVGKTSSQMTIAVNAEDYSAFGAKLAELGKLATTAPAGTPAKLVSAMAKLGGYSGKTDLSDDDVAAIKAQWDAIDNMIGA